MADLRSEVEDDAWVDQFVADWRSVAMPPADRALLEFTGKLTRTPADCGADDVERLRRQGWSDRAIHDLSQVIAYFNYINRIADALGTDPEPEFGEP